MAPAGQQSARRPAASIWTCSLFSWQLSDNCEPSYEPALGPDAGALHPAGCRSRICRRVGGKNDAACSSSRRNTVMLIIVLAYLGGILTIVSPCILPVLPFVF